MKKPKKSWLLTLGGLAVGFSIGLVVCAVFHATAQTKLFTKKDLQQCTLHVHSMCSSNIDKKYMVKDPEYQEKIMNLSTTIEPFRPFVHIIDFVVGTSYNAPYYIFINEKEKYTFAFFDIEEQTDYSFIHRENPMIYVAKDVMDEDGEWQEGWQWWCTMSAENYSELLLSTSLYKPHAVWFAPICAYKYSKELSASLGGDIAQQWKNSGKAPMPSPIVLYSAGPGKRKGQK